MNECATDNWKGSVRNEARAKNSSFRAVVPIPGRWGELCGVGIVHVDASLYTPRLLCSSPPRLFSKMGALSEHEML